MLRAPALRFLETGGSTILDKVGQIDPWRSETFCQCKDCLHCKGRQVFVQEAMANVTGETPRSNPPKGTSSSIPGCTTEGITYTLECQKCRREGIRRSYIEESSRSSYQRGKEHDKDIREGVLDHPMVQHF